MSYYFLSFRSHTKWDRKYCIWARMEVNLGYEVWSILGILSASPKCCSLFSSELIVAIWVVIHTCWSLWEIFSEVRFLARTDGGLLFGELTVISVESYGTLRIDVFESFGLGETEGNLGWRVIERMFLDLFVRGEWRFIHGLYFIMKIITFAVF